MVYNCNSLGGGGGGRTRQEVIIYLTGQIQILT